MQVLLVLAARLPAQRHHHHLVLPEEDPAQEEQEEEDVSPGAHPLGISHPAPSPAHLLCFQAFRTSFSLLFLMLATEKTKMYL